MLKNFLFAIVVLFALLKANALNYKVSTVNRIEFGNGTGLSLRYHPNNRYTTADITYCVYNQQQEVVNCHLKNINNLYLRIKVTHLEQKVNNFRNGDVITSFKLYHEYQLGKGGYQTNDSIIAYASSIKEGRTAYYYATDGKNVATYYNRFEFRTSSGKVVRLIYENAVIERK